MSKLTHDEIRKLVNETTQGDWYIEIDVRDILGNADHVKCNDIYVGYSICPEDAKFIAAASTIIKQLLGEVEEAEKVIDEALCFKGVHDDWQNDKSDLSTSHALAVVKKCFFKALDKYQHSTEKQEVK